MIKFIQSYFNYKDDRGSIQGIINQGNWREVNLIESDKGVIRGNHYHKSSKELFIIIEGQIEVVVERVGKKSSNKETYTVKAGDVFLIEPMVLHSFNVLTKAKWLNMLNKRIEQANPDIHRITQHV
jgi:dTDP-4-dehydrorhamnose 3,5-epimerase-like enzyme